ncbi:uncharacterized protein LOC132193760 [Neocloeon triangulifer]|uniref:uncharacterized protein LOC132193760 n=1 Tax=Neocloeon triangulifer TaxID=2078957 RepID=UPI00286EB668|nr:uncharacterized protein LOC132193760 [Neocloeon triangulifer]
MSLRSAAAVAVRVSTPIGAAAFASPAINCCRSRLGSPAFPPSQLFGLVGSAVGVQSRRHITTKFSSSETDAAQKNPLTKAQAEELILKLTEEEQKILIKAIQTFQSEKMRQEYKGQLAGWRWRSKLGRPSSLPKLGDADVTGSYCPLPEDWLNKKFAETQPPPTTKELANLGLHNALPFIGFGFLDNFIMIVAGDYIDLTIGMTLGISTMAAAALGNTISDVAGIGSAWYVENIVQKFGFKPPPLSPIQLDMKSSRRVANFGRAIGVSLGCLLGMLPLMFLPVKKKREGEQTDDVPSAEEEAEIVTPTN